VDSKNNGKVQCRLCKNWFDYVNVLHLRHIHGITSEEYKEEFPYAPMQGSDYIERSQKACIAGHLEWWNSPEGQERKEEMSRNNPRRIFLNGYFP